MSKTEHLSLLVSVVGLSGCGPEVYKGPGKSSLCFNLLHPTEYLKEHISTLSLQQFESTVIDKQHYVYWGAKTEYYFKLPKSKKSTGEKIMVTVNFHIFEQTEFIEDVTKKPFHAKNEYSERAMKLPHSSNKLQFKTVPLVLSPEKYNAYLSPSTKGMKNGYIFAIDVSKGCPTFHHQLMLLKKMVRPNKKLFVIAATKYDQVDPTFLEEVKIVAKALNVEVIPTSIEMEDGRWVTEAFKYLAIKLFNLQSEDAYGVAGDSYLRYATEPPPSLAKKVEPMSKSKSVEERSKTPPIPPRNYRSESMSQEPPPPGSPLAGSLDDRGYGNFIRQLDKTNLDRTLSLSNPDLEPHTTEIPPNILARKAKTLERKVHPRSMSVHSEAVQNAIPGTSVVPPLPPKPKPLKSPIPKPQGYPIPKLQELPIPKPQEFPTPKTPPAGMQAIGARPLPNLPFVSDDHDGNQYAMRCDYDKIDYSKMRQVREMAQRAKQSAVKSTRSISSSSAVPARDIPRKKVAPTSSNDLKRTPPPVAKKPPVKPRKKSRAIYSPAESEHQASEKKVHGGCQSFEYEDTVTTQSSPNTATSQSLVYEDTITAKNIDRDYDDTGYVNEGADKDKVASNPTQPKYPPRCIPRKYYFLKGYRALPET